MRNRTVWHVVVSCAICVCLLGCHSRTSPKPVQSKTPASASATTSAPGTGPEKWQHHTQGLPFVVGYDKGLQTAQPQGKPAMMFVTTTWCGWCTRLASENFNDPEVKQLLGNFVCVIVDGDTEREAKTRLGATQGYPHVVFVTCRGERLGECLGYKPVSAFKPIVENALGRSRRA